VADSLVIIHSHTETIGRLLVTDRGTGASVADLRVAEAAINKPACVVMATEVNLMR